MGSSQLQHSWCYYSVLGKFGIYDEDLSPFTSYMPGLESFC